MFKPHNSMEKSAQVVVSLFNHEDSQTIFKELNQVKGVQAGTILSKGKAWRRSLRGYFTKLGYKVSKLGHSVKNKVKTWGCTVSMMVASVVFGFLFGDIVVLVTR